MAILIHPARATRNWLRAGVRQGDRMYHVLSDLPGDAGTAELRAFVVRYGMRPEWIQYAGTYREHFDAREDAGLLMLRHGARQATNREVGQVLAAKRAAGAGGSESQSGSD
jgi:Protein of unknown function (DUF4031)